MIFAILSNLGKMPYESHLFISFVKIGKIEPEISFRTSSDILSHEDDLFFKDIIIL